MAALREMEQMILAAETVRRSKALENRTSGTIFAGAAETHSGRKQRAMEAFRQRLKRLHMAERFSANGTVGDREP
ncbi:MAG: hypothetical protein ACLSFT_08560 [Ruminococcus callidus]